MFQTSDVRNTMGTGLDLDFVNATHDVSVVLIEISSLMPTNQTNITSLMFITI